MKTPWVRERCKRYATIALAMERFGSVTCYSVRNRGLSREFIAKRNKRSAAFRSEGWDRPAFVRSFRLDPDPDDGADGRHRVDRRDRLGTDLAAGLVRDLVR